MIGSNCWVIYKNKQIEKIFRDHAEAFNYARKHKKYLYQRREEPRGSGNFVGWMTQVYPSWNGFKDIWD